MNFKDFEKQESINFRDLKQTDGVTKKEVSLLVSCFMYAEDCEVLKILVVWV